MTTLTGKDKLPATQDPVHLAFMREALNMSKLAIEANEVPVGCVFVHNGQILAKGMNDTNRSLCGTRHAEFIAIEQILRKHPATIFQETDLYVTVEPCVMCASALRQLRIRAVYFGCLNDRFGGTGGVLNVHEPGADDVDPGYPVYGGIYHDEAIMVLRSFYVQENERAPDPATKRGRQLKTDIIPFEVVAAGTKGILRDKAMAELAQQKALKEKAAAEEKAQAEQKN